MDTGTFYFNQRGAVGAAGKTGVSTIAALEVSA